MSSSSLLSSKKSTKNQFKNKQNQTLKPNINKTHPPTQTHTHTPTHTPTPTHTQKINELT